MLAVLVHVGALDGIDGWASRELSPLRAGDDGRGRAAPLRIVGDTLQALREPAAPGVTLLLVGGAWWYLRGRGRRRTADAFVAGFAVALVAEVVLKVAVDQEAPGFPREVTGLGTISHGSFPSGHMARAILLAGLAATIWPAHARWFAGWALVVSAGIQLTAMHLLSDIAGGALLGGALLLAALVRADADPRRPDRFRRRETGARSAQPVLARSRVISS